jgi:hypothetical protein
MKRECFELGGKKGDDGTRWGEIMKRNEET